jgi:hypothetical protein
MFQPRFRITARVAKAPMAIEADRQAYLLCARWLKAGFLVIANASTKARSYRLADEYERLMHPDVGLR